MHIHLVATINREHVDAFIENQRAEQVLDSLIFPPWPG
jgi:hypothetical protein